MRPGGKIGKNFLVAKISSCTVYVSGMMHNLIIEKLPFMPLRKFPSMAQAILSI